MTNKLQVADFGVCEMRENELQQVGGGFWPLVVILIIAMVAGCSTPAK